MKRRKETGRKIDKRKRKRNITRQEKEEIKTLNREGKGWRSIISIQVLFLRIRNSNRSGNPKVKVPGETTRHTLNPEVRYRNH